MLGRLEGGLLAFFPQRSTCHWADTGGTAFLRPIDAEIEKMIHRRAGCKRDEVRAFLLQAELDEEVDLDIS